MRFLYRWLIASVLVAVSIAIAIPVYQVGFDVSGMADSSYSTLPPF